MRNSGAISEFITMDEFVDTFTENLISWNSRSNAEHERGRRSDSFPSAIQQSEYVNVKCNLICTIEMRGESPRRHVLVCNAEDTGTHQRGISVRTTCVEHTSGRLLHLILAVPNTSADYLSEDFAKAVSNALSLMTPEPETLYLTIEIPLSILRQSDFTALSPKMRRLSIYLGQAVHVDCNVLTALSLESILLEGCQYRETRVFRNDSRLCDAKLVYTCPNIGELELTADKTSWKRLCFENLDKYSTNQQLETQPVCSCGDYSSLLEALNHSNQVDADLKHQLEPNFRQLFVISLATNLILSCMLLIISLSAGVLYVRNRQRSYGSNTWLEDK